MKKVPYKGVKIVNDLYTGNLSVYEKADDTLQLKQYSQVSEQ